MQRFFDRQETKWRAMDGCLHIYAFPAHESNIRKTFARMARPLEPFPGLSPQPPEYLHATVQRFDAFLPDLEDDRWKTISSMMPSIVKEHAPFTLNFGKPSVQSHAIEAIAHRAHAWDKLVEDIRRCVETTGLEETLTPAPHAPHLTLAYCTAPTPDSEIERALAPTAVSTRFHVDHVALVSVDQDVNAGVYRFQTITEWPLEH